MRVRLCRGCKRVKGPEVYRHDHYCNECTSKKHVDYHRHLCGKEDEGRLHAKSCAVCRSIHTKAMNSNPYRKLSAARIATLQVPSKAQRFWFGRAHAMVMNAIVAGDLPKLDGKIACDDCGKPATEYDHRHYGKPLDVDPVCHPCNKLRGAAKYPSFPLRGKKDA